MNMKQTSNCSGLLLIVLLNIEKITSQGPGMQLILIDCYSPEKPTGPHNYIGVYAHLILTVLTKDANSNPKNT